MKNNRNILLGFFIALVLIATGFYLYREFRKSLVATVEKSMKSSSRLAFTIQVFQVVNSRWPNNIDELKSFSDEYYMDFDFEPYRNWSFEESSDHRLKVRFIDKLKDLSGIVDVPTFPQTEVSALKHSIFPKERFFGPKI